MSTTSWGPVLGPDIKSPPVRTWVPQGAPSLSQSILPQESAWEGLSREALVLGTRSERASKVPQAVPAPRPP